MMRFRLILTFSCLLLIINCSFSQGRIISLSNEIIDSPSDYYFVGDVINVTDESDCIGYVLKSGIPIPAYFKSNIDVELLSFLQNQFYEKEELIELIIRINKLFYYESLSSGYGNKVRVVDLNCSFIIKDSAGYHEVFTAACSVKQKNQNYTTAGVIASTFEKAFKQFHHRMQNGVLDRVTISKEMLSYNPLKDSCYMKKQLSVNRKRQGIYKTFYDFRDNTPDTIKKFTVKYKDKKTELSDIMLHTAKLYINNERIENVWGFANGNDVYWFIDDSYYLMKKDDISYYSEVVRNKNYAGVGAITGAGLGGISNGMSGSIAGAVGGALLGSLFGAASAEQAKVNLNFTTGTFDSYLQENQKKAESVILFYASGYNKTDSGIKLSIDGKYCCTLLPNTWTSISLTSEYESVNVLFEVPNKDSMVVEIVPSLFKLDYYFILEKKKKPLRITKADIEKRSFINRSISKKNRVESIVFDTGIGSE